MEWATKILAWIGMVFIICCIICGVIIVMARANGDDNE